MIFADLEGKKALVTGGASGLGLGAVKLFAEMGCQVAINDLPGKRLENSVKKLEEEQRDVFAAPADLRDANSTQQMIDDAAGRMGGLDYLLNVAGHPVTLKVIPAADLESQTEEFWSEIISINLLSAFRTAKAAAPWLKKSQGAIVNTSSMSGFRSGGSSSPYCVAKGGIVTLTKELARGLSPDIRVNAIAPMYVHPDDTQFPLRWDTVYEDSKALPIPRPGRAREYAEAMLFLCAGATYMTGETLHVDGGYNA